MGRKRIEHQPVDIRMALGLKLPPSRGEVLAARSARGGWTQASLAAWGIPWPPRAGWRGRLELRRRRVLGLREQSPPPAC